MIQRFIELGEGYSDLYELCELMQTNQHRYHNVCILSTTKNNVLCVSIALILKPRPLSVIVILIFFLSIAIRISISFLS